jgi:hypothetical protein
MKKVTNGRPCTIVECDKTCSPRSQYDICELCRGNICRANGLGPAWVLQRKSKLAKYTDRMQHLKYRRER